MVDSAKRSFVPARPPVVIDAEVFDLHDTPYPTDAFRMVTEGLRQGAAVSFGSAFLVALPRIVFADVARLPALPEIGASMDAVRRSFVIRAEIAAWIGSVCSMPCKLVFVPVQNQYGEVPCHWVPALACGSNCDADVLEEHLVEAGIDEAANAIMPLMTSIDMELLRLLRDEDVIAGEVAGPGLDRLVNLRVAHFAWRMCQPMLHARVWVNELGERVAQYGAAPSPAHLTPGVGTVLDNLILLAARQHRSLGEPD